MWILCPMWSQKLPNSDCKYTLLDASEAVCPKASNLSHFQASWSFLQYDGRSQGLCCGTVSYLLGIGNSCWFMAALSIQKYHTNLSWDSSVEVIDGYVNRIATLVCVSPAPSFLCIDWPQQKEYFITCMMSFLHLASHCGWGVSEYSCYNCRQYVLNSDAVLCLDI